jgi:hypothetical protein
MTDPAEVAAAFDGTGLAGLPVTHGLDGTLVVADIDPAGLLEAWRAAHALVPLTGRWPILIATDPDDDLLCDPDPEPDPIHPPADELAELDRVARTIDPWPFFVKGPPRLCTADQAGFIGRGSGMDLTAELERHVTFPAPESVVQRWMFDRVGADPDLVAEVRRHTRYAVRTDRWFVPKAVAMLLLPTASPWLAPAWVEYARAPGHDRELAAALWQWHHRWDARLVACWDTMLQFVVDRSPGPGEAAFELAGQLLDVATHLEMHQWELATVLPDGTAWFLHSRP